MLRCAGEYTVPAVTPHPDSGAAGYPPDYLSTLPSRELQRIMHESPTLPLAVLRNQGGFSVDYDNRRVWRDCFWKGSFAKDTLLGWEERLLTPIHDAGAQYTGGRFWKRFELHGDEARAYIVNYGVGLLPGRAVVRPEVFASDTRPYLRTGDTVFLLTYLNQPYRVVHDLIKAVDPDNCIGVMHLGSYPRGRVFATFVMSRSNHPFEKMAIPDHDAIFASSHARAPLPAKLEGRWRGHLVLFSHPERALHHQFNPPLLRLDASRVGETVETRMRTGLLSSRTRATFDADEVILEHRSGRRDHLRRLDDETLLGRRTRAGSSQVTLRYVLTRMR